MFELILLVHSFATLMMAGMIWMVQIVHYPLFAQVGEANFQAYETAHMSRMSLLVMPVMLVELLSGLALVVGSAPPEIATWIPWVNLGLLAIIWIATMWINLPQHSMLALGFDQAVHSALVQSNWLRTIAWSGRGILTLWMLGRLLLRS